MFAIANEKPNLEAIRELIAAGADLTIKDVYGDTALDWARKFGPGPVVMLLEKAGAKGRDTEPAPRAGLGLPPERDGSNSKVVRSAGSIQPEVFH